MRSLGNRYQPIPMDTPNVKTHSFWAIVLDPFLGHTHGLTRETVLFARQYVGKFVG